MSDTRFSFTAIETGEEKMAVIFDAYEPGAPKGCVQTIEILTRHLSECGIVCEVSHQFSVFQAKYRASLDA